MPGPSGMRLPRPYRAPSYWVPSHVLLTCEEIDPQVPELQIPIGSACIAATAASKIDHISKTAQRAARGNISSCRLPPTACSTLDCLRRQLDPYCSETMATPSPGHSSPPWHPPPVRSHASQHQCVSSMHTPGFDAAFTPDSAGMQAVCRVTPRYHALHHSMMIIWNSAYFTVYRKL